MKSLIIHLVSQTKERFDLKFRIRQTDVAQRWASLIKKDLLYGIREGERFRNFCENLEEEIKIGINKVVSLIELLKPLHPELDFGVVDFTDVQSEVNRIHVEFADRHLVKKDLTQQSFQYWNDLNATLHQLEFYIHDIQRKKISKLYIPKATIIVTFYNKEIQTLTEKDYNNATLNKVFGNIYLNYSRVGRHIEELYWCQDDKIPLEHIQLFDKISSDFYVYLGPNYDHDYHLYLLNEIKKWFCKKERPFSKIGLHWNPKRLCIGKLSVAYLEEECCSIQEIKYLQRKISHFQKVESIEICS